MSAPLVPSGLPYHRRITVTPAPGMVEAEMQDHCHHVRVRFHHDGERILDGTGEGIRLPWHTCPLGVAAVGRLAGMALADVPEPTGWPGGRTANCVHATDLSLVALAHLGDVPFSYEITVTPATGTRRQARLERAGVVLADWKLDGDSICEPADLAGRRLAKPDFTTWTAELDPAAREVATVLRRACHIAPSRDVDLDAVAVAADSVPPDSSCYTLQPSVGFGARRVRGSSRATLTG